MEGLKSVKDIVLPVIPDDTTSAYAHFWIRTKDPAARNKLKSFLHRKKIETSTHYVPLHLSKMGENLGYKKGMLPNTELASETILRLPFYTQMSPLSQDYVIKEIKEFFHG